MSTLLKRLCSLNIKFIIRKKVKQVQSSRTNARSLCSSIKCSNIYLLDEDNSNNLSNKNSVNKFTNRTHTCGELRCHNIGEVVKLCGWLEHQRMNKFVILRDAYGETQLLIRNEDLVTQNLLKSVPLESIIEVNGTVLSRPKNMINKKQTTGDIEVLVDEFKVLNKAKESLPFNIREFQKAKESLRMQYRYLDLRFPQMQRNLRVRSEIISKMREFLIKNHFVDVETPTLFKATPGVKDLKFLCG